MRRVPLDAITAYQQAFATNRNPVDVRGLEAKQWDGFLDGYLGNPRNDIANFPVLKMLYNVGYEQGMRTRTPLAA